MLQLRILLLSIFFSLSLPTLLGTSLSKPKSIMFSLNSHLMYFYRIKTHQSISYLSSRYDAHCMYQFTPKVDNSYNTHTEVKLQLRRMHNF